MPQTDRPRQGVQAFLDVTPMRPYHWRIFALCALCLVFDGFDAQSMGYVAPALREGLALRPEALGPVFSASLFGMLVGALCLGVLADRIGRRPVLIGALAFCGVMMYATAHVQTVQQLVVLRFITGLGLGTLLPTTLAMASEFAPSKSRAGVVMLMSIGFVSGAAIGGVISSWLIPRFGWASVFTVAGAASVLTAALMFWLLPESIQFLAEREGGMFTRTNALARRLSSNGNTVEFEWFNERAEQSQRSPKKEGWDGLFKGGFAVTTILLWLLNFANLLNLYFLSNWLPTLLRQSGIDLHLAVIASAVLQSGGIPATLLLGALSKRYKVTHLLFANFVVGTIAMATIGMVVTSSVPLLFVAIFFSGFCVVGGQSGVNALGAQCYPTAMRATGMGWASGIGRFGSVSGPLVGGAMLSLNFGVPSVFFAAALAGALSVVSVFLLGARVKKHNDDHSDAVAPTPSH